MSGDVIWVAALKIKQKFGSKLNKICFFVPQKGQKEQKLLDLEEQLTEKLYP